MNESQLNTRFRQQFEASIATKQAALQQMLPDLARAATLLIEALKADHKLLVCGNGGSAADAQHFAAELSCRFERERPGLPAIALTVDTSALTAIGNDYSFEQLFSRQVQALGRKNDVLMAISTSGNSPNVLKAIATAHAQGLRVLAFTGRDGGKIAKLLRENDVELRVPSSVTARIQEVHILLLHCLCDAIDESLYPA